MIYQKRYNIIPDSEGFIKLNSLGLKTTSGKLLIIDPRKGAILNDSLAPSSTFGESDWSETLTTDGSSDVNSGPDGNHPTGATLRTGGTTDGACFFNKQLGAFCNCQAAELWFELACSIVELSTAAQEFTITAGFLDNVSSKNSTNGIYFLYDRLGISSPQNLNWHVVTAQGGTRTTTNTGVVVTATQKYTLRIVLNAAGTEVKAYIDRNLVATITTNIPTGLSQTFTPGMGIAKLAGTSSRSFRVHRLTQTSLLDTTQ